MGNDHKRLGVFARDDAKLMEAAEAEARERGCEHVFLDTLSFQALGFHLKLGYTEFNRLSGFSGKYDRHYLHNRLDAMEHV
jgi:GNAT superfamily N-acetyltransferase